MANLGKERYKFAVDTVRYLDTCKFQRGDYRDNNFLSNKKDPFGREQKIEKFPQPVADGEIAKGFINLYEYDGKQKWLREAEETGYFLANCQNRDGSWNETVPYYNYPSIVSTTVVAEALLRIADHTHNRKLLNCAIKGGDYILKKEVGYGVFHKSTFIFTNTLNVNAHAGAALSKLYSTTKEKRYLEAAERVIFSIAKHQFPDGALPYSDAVRSYPNQLHYNVKCIHYQGISLFYLLKIRENIGGKKPILENMLKIGAQYLDSCIRENGKILWEKDTFTFEYFQNAAYALAISVLPSFYGENTQKNKIAGMLRQLSEERAKNSGFPRREALGFGYYTQSFISHATQTVSAGNFSLRERLFRVKELFERVKDTKERRSHLFTTAKIFECMTKF